MTEGGGFGVLLERLAERRQLDIGVLGRSADVAESELLSVSRGGEPSPCLLRRLAPALGLHTSDLFVIAGAEVPDDLAPADPKAGWRVPHLVRRAVALPSEQRNVLRRFVASLPREERTRPVRRPLAYGQYPDGPGALLVRLVHNRNLGWTAMAKTFLVVTNRYWSAATYGGVGRGTIPLTADLLADFCAVLDVPSDDLAALTGIALPAVSSHAKPSVAGVAELIWDVRDLTERRLQEIGDLAGSMEL
ncbi:hypothetical protein AB0O64_36655 [Streptomyces sp. NPDC088341]|uniref:hypothetical protein n=1 Tax=Streptomyces sp. NPDC088341 TaxID=3154870 RepID=UPI0034409329